MTDTTDIKVLRERLAIEANRVRDQRYVDEHCCVVNKRDLLTTVELLGKFEAERQRAAGSEEELHKALHREKAAERKLLAAQDSIGVLEGVIARKEFDSQKGEQAIVSFTSESALNDVADGDLKVGYQLSHADSAMLKRVAEALIAIREAQDVPVGFTSESALDDVADGETSMFGPDRVVGRIPLFTAQQLPVVPGRVSAQDMRGTFNYLMSEEEAQAAANGFNQCLLEISAAPKPGGE